MKQHFHRPFQARYPLSTETDTEAMEYWWRTSIPNYQKSSAVVEHTLLISDLPEKFRFPKEQ